MKIIKHAFDYCEEYLLSLTSTRTWYDFLKKSQCSLKESLTFNDFLPNILDQVIVVAWLVSKKMHLWPVHGLNFTMISSVFLRQLNQLISPKTLITLCIMLVSLTQLVLLNRLYAVL